MLLRTSNLTILLHVPDARMFMNRQQSFKGHDRCLRRTRPQIDKLVKSGKTAGVKLIEC